MAITLRLWADDEDQDNEDVTPTITNTLKDDSRAVLHLGDTKEHQSVI